MSNIEYQLHAREPQPRKWIIKIIHFASWAQGKPLGIFWAGIPAVVAFGIWVILPDSISARILFSRKESEKGGKEYVKRIKGHTH